ncbi:MAG TPA: MlaD family protein [Verrucomicrobiae bacterium]|nr:MlaD family protein [Verrucomicrobiae bacterium]
MPLQDLTPQLRTRLSRVERLVGLFVTVATILLIIGLTYYVAQTAKRKGWGRQKLPYFLLIDSATGLQVGSRVKLMGFDIGEITQITAGEPYDPYNVFVQIRVWEPYYGYIWSDSRAKIFSADFLGGRYVEVTKGTNAPPSYLFNQLRTVTIQEAQGLANRPNIVLGQEIYATNHMVLGAYAPLNSSNLNIITQLGFENIRIIDKTAKTKKPDAMWDDKIAAYKPVPADNKGYWLEVEESPALTERLERVVNTVEHALPDVLALTNKLASVLTNAVAIVTHADDLLVTAKPVLTNMASRLDQVLSSSDKTIITAQTNIAVIVSNLAVTLENVGDLTSNLNAQVQANGFILRQVSDLIVHTDEAVQGLKRHWLLKGAFGPNTNATPTSVVKPRLE